MLWVVGANPLERAALRAQNAFVVVQDMFLTETAQRADVVLPAASAYEKAGTVTNVCGEVQRLKKAVSYHGRQAGSRNHRADRQGNGRGAASWARGLPTRFSSEIRKTVHGLRYAAAVLATGGAAQTMPVNGRVTVESRPDLIRSAHDTVCSPRERWGGILKCLTP